MTASAKCVRATFGAQGAWCLASTENQILGRNYGRMLKGYCPELSTNFIQSPTTVSNPMHTHQTYSRIIPQVLNHKPPDTVRVAVQEPNTRRALQGKHVVYCTPSFWCHSILIPKLPIKPQCPFQVAFSLPFDSPVWPNNLRF